MTDILEIKLDVSANIGELFDFSACGALGTLVPG